MCSVLSCSVLYLSLRPPLSSLSHNPFLVPLPSRVDFSISSTNHRKRRRRKKTVRACVCVCLGVGGGWKKGKGWSLATVT